MSTFRVWLLALAIGLALDPAQVGGMVGLTTVAALVPVSVSGVGTRDAMLVALVSRLVAARGGERGGHRALDADPGAEPGERAGRLCRVVGRVAGGARGMIALTPQGMAWGAAALALALAAALTLIAVARGWRGAGRLTAGARPDERRRGWQVAGLGGALLLLALASGVMARRNEATPVPAACRGVVASGRTNLLPRGATPFAAFAGGTIATDGPADWVKPQAGSDLLEPRAPVQPGAHYCYSVETSGDGHGQVIAKWQDATLRDLPAPDSYSALPPQPVGAPLRGEFAAPAGAVYLQMLVRPSDGAPLFRNPTLAQAGLRVEPWPDGRAGALAFSFDWETAMGGLIHSQEPARHGSTP